MISMKFFGILCQQGYSSQIFLSHSTFDCAVKPSRKLSLLSVSVSLCEYRGVFSVEVLGHVPVHVSVRIPLVVAVLLKLESLLFVRVRVSVKVIVVSVSSEELNIVKCSHTTFSTFTTHFL